MNKQKAEETKLETKLCISTDSTCVLCHRRNIRKAGTTETYLAGTNDWVCYDCARGIDPELAEFAYYPERYQRADHAPFHDEGWGVCPECGRLDQWCNVGRVHWVVCLRHGFRWSPGENLLSGWLDEPKSLHRANAEFLSRFREVEPWSSTDEHPPSSLDNLDSLLAEEISKSTRRFIQEENSLDFHIGRSNRSTNRALVFTIEAARLLCCGPEKPRVLRLLRMAITEVEAEGEESVSKASTGRSAQY